MDAQLLARLQFALTVGFHFLFPPITIGLAWLLVVYEWLGWRRGSEDYVRAGKFFAGILGLTFVTGVATGIVMEFQFGTNWAEYSKFVGDVFGAPLAAEGVLAFFLESGFLGLYLFGRGRVSKGMHWFSALMVAVGATLSAFWIIVANSWQQTPAGFVIRNGRAELTSFVQAVFNPSSMIRYHHTVSACLVAGAFLAAGASAFLILRGRSAEVARKTLKIALIFGFCAAVATLYPFGHQHALQVARTQPEKFAAMEGLIRGGSQAPMLVFGIPQDRPPGVKHAVEIPGLLSWLAFGDVDAPVQGIQDLNEAGWPTPPFVICFVSFHTMAGLGALFIGMTALGLVFLWRGMLFDTSHWPVRMYLWALVLAIPLPLLACELGWILAEVGRQPWVVYRVMKTADAISKNVSAGQILFSIIVFGLIYLALGSLYVFVLVKKIRRGPEPAEAAEARV